MVKITSFDHLFDVLNDRKPDDLFASVRVDNAKFVDGTVAKLFYNQHIQGFFASYDFNNIVLVREQTGVIPAERLGELPRVLRLGYLPGCVEVLAENEKSDKFYLLFQRNATPEQALSMLNICLPEDSYLASPPLTLKETDGIKRIC